MAWALILLLMCPALRALDGRLLFPDGTPVAGAQVTILEHPGQSRTDQQGRFRWSPDPPVPFEVRVELPGGHDTLHAVVRETVSEGTLELVVRPLFREDLTVTAGNPARTGTTPASALELVTHEELAQTRPSRLIEAIERIPGVARVSAGHAAVPSIRGLARGRTLILLDGARVISERRVGPSATFLDPFFLDRIEVVRGPGSVAYGSDAFGGVIHAQTRKPRPESTYGGRFMGSLGYGMPEQSAGVELSRSLESGSVFFLGSMRNYGDYRSSGVTVDNSAARNRSFLAGTLLRVAGGELSLGWQTDRGHDLGRPTLRSPHMRTFYPEENSDRMHLAFDSKPIGGFDQVRIEGSMGRYALITDRERLPAPNRPRQLQRSRVAARHLDFRVQAISPLKWIRLELGFDVNGRFGLHSENTTRSFDAGNRTTGTLAAASIEDARRIDLAPFLSAELPVNSYLSLWAGARWDQVSSSSRGSLGNFDRINRAFSGFFCGRRAAAAPASAHGSTLPGLPGTDTFGPLFPGDQRPRPDSRQPQPGAGNQSAVGRFGPLVRKRLALGPVPLPVPDPPVGGAFRSGTPALLLPQSRIGPVDRSGGGITSSHRRGDVAGSRGTRVRRPDPRGWESPRRRPGPFNCLDHWKNARFPGPPMAPGPYLCPRLQIRPHGSSDPGFRHPGSLLELAVGFPDPAPFPGKKPHRQGLPGQPRPLVRSGPRPRSSPKSNVYSQ